MSLEPGEAQHLTNDALSDLIQQIDPNAMLTRWVVLAEIVDAEGERGLWTLSAPDQRAWDTLGLLDYARALEHAAQRADP